MKKYTSLLIAVLCMSAMAYAQDSSMVYYRDSPKNEICLGYGLGSADIFAYKVLNALFIAPWSNGESPYSIRSSGVINIGYQHALSDKIRIGGTFLSEKITFKHKTSSGYESYYDNLHAFMVTSKLIYRIENKWIIYGRADLGMIWKEQTRPSEPVTATSRLAFQVSPAGFSYGTALKGFCELGFGDLGFINCGLTCSF